MNKNGKKSAKISRKSTKRRQKSTKTLWDYLAVIALFWALFFVSALDSERWGIMIFGFIANMAYLIFYGIVNGFIGGFES